MPYNKPYGGASQQSPLAQMVESAQGFFREKGSLNELVEMGQKFKPASQNSQISSDSSSMLDIIDAHVERMTDAVARSVSGGGKGVSEKNQLDFAAKQLQDTVSSATSASSDDIEQSPAFKKLEHQVDCMEGEVSKLTSSVSTLQQDVSSISTKVTGNHAQAMNLLQGISANLDLTNSPDVVRKEPPVIVSEGDTNTLCFLTIAEDTHEKLVDHVCCGGNSIIRDLKGEITATIH